MTPWDGIGLPPSVQARLDRATESRTHTSLLSVAGQIGADSTGFQVIGDVMGCTVLKVEPMGTGNCGFFGGIGRRHATPEVISSGSDRAPGGFASYVAARYFGWDSAIGRMRSEASGLEADGVIDVRLSERALEHDRCEFVAIGTAVRSSGPTHLDAPFTTTFGGQAFAKLVFAGWMPASIVVGMSVAIRHDDYRMRLSRRALAGNSEIEGLSALANVVRQDAREQLESRTARGGADGVILSSEVPAQLRVVRAGLNHYDHVAEAAVFASAVVRFSSDASPRSVTSRVMPLTAQPPGAESSWRASASV